MGVSGLWDVLNDCSSNIQLSELKGSRFAIDASIWIYQLSSIQSQASFVCEGLFRRLCKLTHFGIMPIFVFDGRPSELKLKTTRKRNRNHRIAQSKLSQLAKRALALKCLSHAPNTQHETQSREPKQYSDSEDSLEYPKETRTGLKRIAGSSRKVFEFVKSTNIISHSDKEILESCTENQSPIQSVHHQEEELFIDSHTDFEDSKIGLLSNIYDHSKINPAVTSTTSLHNISATTANTILDNIQSTEVSFNADNSLTTSIPQQSSQTPPPISVIDHIDDKLLAEPEAHRTQYIEIEAQKDEEPISTELLGSLGSSLNPSLRKDHSSQSYRLESEAVVNFKSLLSCFGFSWIVAPSEAEAQCVAFQKNGCVDYVITDDSDAFLFGASKVIRHFFSKTKSPKVYDISKSKYNQDVLIFLGSLLGTDYFEGIDGVGPKKAIAKLFEIYNPRDTNNPEFTYLLDIYSQMDNDYVKHRDFLVRYFYQAYKNPTTDASPIVAADANINEHSLIKFLSTNTQIDNNALKKELSLLCKRSKLN